MDRPSKRPVNYLSNKLLLEEIWKSKLTYCDIYDDRYTMPDVITDDLTTVTEPNLTVRLQTEEHIPLATETGKGKLGHLDGITFDPFILYRTEIGHNSGEIAFVEIGRSHHKDGEFSANHGQLTPKLGRQIMLMVDRYGLKPNFRGYSYIEDMKSEATLVLLQNILKFNEGKGNNPFAYMTTLVHNSFLRQLNSESKQRDIRDDLLVSAGAKPSISRQMKDDRV